MKKITAAFFLCSLSFFAQAIECPKVFLECDHKVLQKNGSFGVVETKAVSFVGRNILEPSEEANDCVAEVRFKSQKSNDLFIVTSDKYLTTHFFIINENGGALKPQFTVDANPQQFITLSNGEEQVMCILD